MDESKGRDYTGPEDSPWRQTKDILFACFFFFICVCVCVQGERKRKKRNKVRKREREREKDEREGGKKKSLKRSKSFVVQLVEA